MHTDQNPINVSHYQEGYDAGIQGKSNAINPYEHDSKPFDDWLDGWVDGRTALNRETQNLPPRKISEHYT